MNNTPSPQPEKVSNCVIVPRSELVELEEARLFLFKLLAKECENTMFLVHLETATGPMWRLANRKWPAAAPACESSDADAADEDAYRMGHRDGYDEAVQDIDILTGGDGEYRYCTDHDPDRHTPDAETMKRRIEERFSYALDYATRLAKALHRDHYADVAPKWEPFDDLPGVLSQIDNMITGWAAGPPPAAKAQGWRGISTAPRDGTIILAVLAGVDYPHPVYFGHRPRNSNRNAACWRMAWDQSPIADHDLFDATWTPVPPSAGGEGEGR